MPANLSMAGIFVLIFIKSYYNDFKVIFLQYTLIPPPS